MKLITPTSFNSLDTFKVKAIFQSMIPNFDVQCSNFARMLTYIQDWKPVGKELELVVNFS